MPLWKYELKKMLIYHKGLLYIILFFMISMLSHAWFDEPPDPDTETYEALYMHYLSQLKGKLTPDKERELEEEAQRMTAAEVSLRQLTDRYYAGKIGEVEYQEAADELEHILRYDKGLELIYEQYTYIRENLENRYFLDRNGWDALLSNDRLDILYVLLLMLIITPVFCIEHESRMQPLILTMKRGSRNAAAIKMFLVAIVVAVISLLHSCWMYGFFAWKYGLQDGHFPLQSLSYYATSPKDVALQDAFAWIAAGRLFGSLCFAVLIMFVSVCVNRYALTLFISSAIILLPYYGLPMESTKYMIPGPLAFLISTGFFRGNEYMRDPFSDQLELVFQEVSPSSLAIMFGVTLVLSIGMIAWIMRRNTNNWETGRTGHRVSGRRILRSLFNLIIASCILSGCTSDASEETRGVFNYSSRQSYDNERYHFYIDQSNPEQVQIMYRDRSTGQTHKLIRNPLTALSRVESVLYGKGDLIYYLKYDLDKSGVRELVDRFSVIEVDTRTFSENIIYEKKLDTNREAMLGLWETNDQETRAFHTISAFFLDERYLYLISGDEIKQVDLTFDRIETIVRMPVIRSVAFDGRTIYYTNERSEIVAYDTKTRTSAVIPGIATHTFVLTDSELYYVNLKDRQTIYAMNLHDGEFHRVTDVPALGLYMEDQAIYYISKADMASHRLP